MGAADRTEGTEEGKAVEEGRANIWCREDLHRELKVEAARRGITLRELVEKYLDLGLEHDRKLGVIGGQGV